MQTMLSSEVTFISCLVKYSDYILCPSVIDKDDRDDHTRDWAYDEILNEWGYDDYPFTVSAICLFVQANHSQTRLRSVCISTEGLVHFHGMIDLPTTQEKIPLSGIFSEGAEGLGYMTGLNQIGDHLYACGGRGQVYKRLGPDQWVQMDAGIRQSVKTPLDECHHLMDINGPSEDAIYATANHGKVLFWNGKHWRQVETPNHADLGKILVESPEVVWIAGGEGTLLKGNANDGFTNVSPVGELLFTDIVRHEGVLYLASNLGLYAFDEKRRQMKRVKTGLKPEHTDTHSLGSKEGVLWSIGGKDIVRLKEGTWKRIDHGDNPPIR